ncbi:hypothetical protein LN050_07125 [Comamonadaceae bacterium M7527]|nr:hypothetical protein LN050_07125 [Comamonadaceae bacterium M7527]
MAIALVRSTSLPARYGLGLCAHTARWVLMLLAWVWLGEQGIKEGWLYASGVWPLVLWWGSRLAARHMQRRVDAHMQVLVIRSSGTAAAIVLAACRFVPDSLSFFMLLIAAMCWGVCSGASEHAQQRGSTPQHTASPLLAALVVGALWWAPGFLASALVALAVLVCATVIAGNTSRTASVAQPTHQDNGLASLAMGLMMGTMWQSSAWCVGLGWSDSSGVIAHLLLMALLPAVVMHLGKVVKMQAQTLQVLTLGILASGSLLLGLAGPAYGIWGMILHALAWSLQYVNAAPALPKASDNQLKTSLAGQAMLLAVGPVALWLIGETIQRNGPLVLQLVQMLLSCACVAALYRLARGRGNPGVLRYGPGA